MSNRLRRRPRLETLEDRIAMSVAAVPGDVGGQVDPALQAYTDAFGAFRGQARYNPAEDANQNGFIGQEDARPVLRAVAPITPHIAQTIAVHLAPADQVQGPRPENSGGVTRRVDVTVVGRTTPNSIVFLDAPLHPTHTTNIPARAPTGAYKFAGAAIVSDSRGFFSYKIHLSDQLTQTEYLAFDPFGHHKIFAFPILRLTK